MTQQDHHRRQERERKEKPARPANVKDEIRTQNRARLTHDSNFDSFD